MNDCTIEDYVINIDKKLRTYNMTNQITIFIVHVSIIDKTDIENSVETFRENGNQIRCANSQKLQ